MHINSIPRFSRLSFLSALALLLAFSLPSISARDVPEAGTLVIKYSPTLGINVALSVNIDGRPAGVFTRGHTYQRYLPPGRHVVSVMRSGLWRTATQTVIHVRPGATYGYVAKWGRDEVFLQPVRRGR